MISNSAETSRVVHFGREEAMTYEERWNASLQVKFIAYAAGAPRSYPRRSSASSGCGTPGFSRPISRPGWRSPPGSWQLRFSAPGYRSHGRPRAVITTLWPALPSPFGSHAWP